MTAFHVVVRPATGKQGPDEGPIVYSIDATDQQDAAEKVGWRGYEVHEVWTSEDLHAYIKSLDD